jgi:hypothetical protein
MMQDQDIQPALGHLEAALESSCATLIALEATRAQDRAVRHDAGPIEGQIADAIASLRAAITELRAMHEIETSTLAFGFVLGDDPVWAQGQLRRRHAPNGQSIPRRTA